MSQLTETTTPSAAGDETAVPYAIAGQPQLPPDAETPPSLDPAIQPKPANSDSWWDLLRILIYALLIALVERTLFFQPYSIPSGSMEETLLIGDYLFAEKFSYGYSRYALPWGRFVPSFGRIMAKAPERGDVAVFALPSDPKLDFVKRIVGLPGDRVQVVGGVLYLNDTPVSRRRVADHVEEHNGYRRRIARYRETLPNGKSYYVLDREIDGLNDNTPVYTVPAGHYFMMGDNRDDSDDSRGIVGYLPAENLIGRAELKFLSIDERKTQFYTFWKWPSAIRWHRLFRGID